MEVLKIKLYQESACYKKPFAYKVTETYPLPPYSTVIGMLHNILKADSYIPMKVSIQGDYESLFNSYNTMYFYKAKSVTKMPINIHMLYGINLVIHVESEKETLNKIVEGILNSDEYFSLGRREDLVNIKSFKYVQVNDVDVDDLDDNLITKYPIYIPKEKLPCKLEGISYRLNCRYKVKNDLRQWQKVNALYVDKDKEIDGITKVDEDGDLVFLS